MTDQPDTATDIEPSSDNIPCCGYVPQSNTKRISLLHDFNLCPIRLARKWIDIQLIGGGCIVINRVTWPSRNKSRYRSGL